MSRYKRNRPYGPTVPPSVSDADHGNCLPTETVGPLGRKVLGVARMIPQGVALGWENRRPSAQATYGVSQKKTGILPNHSETRLLDLFSSAQARPGNDGNFVPALFRRFCHWQFRSFAIVSDFQLRLSNSLSISLPSSSFPGGAGLLWNRAGDILKGNGKPGRWFLRACHPCRDREILIRFPSCPTPIQ